MKRMSYFITCSNAQRLAIWQKLFGMDYLPVLAPRPRWQFVDGREIPAYDLALSQLSQWQRIRLATYTAKRQGRPYPEVLAELQATVSWPVKARDCVVVVEATELRPSPFSLPVAGYGRLALAG